MLSCLRSWVAALCAGEARRLRRENADLRAQLAAVTAARAGRPARLELAPPRLVSLEVAPRPGAPDGLARLPARAYGCYQGAGMSEAAWLLYARELELSARHRAHFTVRERAAEGR